VKSDFSYSFQFNEMARPAGLEPAAPCLEVTQYKILSAAAGVATRKRVIYLALELDRTWTETGAIRQTVGRRSRLSVISPWMLSFL